MLLVNPMVLFECIPLLLLSVLMVRILHLRAYRIFPWFCIYICFDVLIGIIRFLTHNNARIFFTVFWATEVAFDLLELAALYEVYRSVFRGLTHTWWFRIIFPLTFLTAMSLTIAHAIWMPVQSTNYLFITLVTSDLGVQLFQGLIFVVLVACVGILGIRWRRYAFGITAGFGFYGTIALAATTRFSVFVTSSTIVWGWILVGAYSGAVLIWLWYFRKPQEPEPSGVSEEFIQKARSELELYRKLIRRARDL